MNTKRLLVMTSATILMLGLAIGAAAQANAGGARLAMAPASQQGSMISVPLRIDLSGILVAGQPAELGGYVIRIDFDPAVVQFVDAGPGADFGEQVSTTVADKANAEGTVRITSVKPGEDGPMGLVNVANVRFRSQDSNATDSIRISIESLSSVLLRDGTGRLLGPAAIPLASGDTRVERSAAVE